MVCVLTCDHAQARWMEFCKQGEFVSHTGETDKVAVSTARTVSDVS